MSGDDRTRVAVTGLGVKTPAGCEVDTFWSTILAGESVAGPIERFDASDLPVRFACEVKDFEGADYVGKKRARRLDRVAMLGLAAAVDAHQHAGDIGVDPSRCAVVAGVGIGGLAAIEEHHAKLLDRGPQAVTPFLVPMMMPNATAGEIAMELGWTGPNLCVATACATGTHALGEAARLVATGAADVALAGGAEAVVTPMSIAAFARMGALSDRNDEPQLASRPFDADRDGFVIGEGAGFVVLERWDHAVERGATIYGEVIGYARNSDAHHVTAPSPGGEGAAACMTAALASAGLEPGAVVHVNAHGTSTPLNDKGEAEALVKVFGEEVPPVTSTKGVTGHLIAAAGAVEAIASLLTLREGVIPPTANHEKPEPEITVDVVAGEPREIEPGPVLSNSFGFGGHNATLVLAPAGDDG